MQWHDAPLLLVSSTSGCGSVMKIRKRGGNPLRGVVSCLTSRRYSSLFWRNPTRAGQTKPDTDDMYSHEPTSDKPTFDPNRPSTCGHRAERMEVTLHSPQLPLKSMDISGAVSARFEALNGAGTVTDYPGSTNERCTLLNGHIWSTPRMEFTVWLQCSTARNIILAAS